MRKNQHLYNCHTLFNDYFFNGLLNENIIISITERLDLDGCEIWGYYDDQRNEIAITNNGMIYLTLLHEMIHQWQKEYDLADKDHGRAFRRMARFMEITLNIKKGSI